MSSSLPLQRHWSIASRTRTPDWFGTQQFTSFWTCRSPWITQPIAKQLLLLFWMPASVLLMVLAKLSASALSQLSHLDRDRPAAQLMPAELTKLYQSQIGCRIKCYAFIRESTAEGSKQSSVQFWGNSSGRSLFRKPPMNNDMPRKGFPLLPSKKGNIPESIIAKNYALFSWLETQSAQSELPTPPALVPARATELDPSPFLRRACITPIVFDEPRKCSDVPLTFIGQLLNPWQRLPSQQRMQTFEQLQKSGFTVSLRENRIQESQPGLRIYPSPLLLPRQVCERRLQAVIVEFRSGPMHRLPPSKQMSNLLGSKTSRQQLGTVPSRHLAQEFASRGYFLRIAAALSTTKYNNIFRYLD